MRRHSPSCLTLKRIFLALAAICAAPLWSPAGAAEAVDSAERFSRPLIVGAATDSFPKSYLDEEGRCAGFAVDLLDAVAGVMGLKIQRVTAPAGELHARFQAGEFDLLQVYSPGPGRDLFADFSVQFMNLQGCLFVRKDGNRIHRLEDLNEGELVIVGVGSIAEQFVRDRGLKSRIVYRASVADGLRALDQGRHDALFSSRLTALSIIERDQLKNLRALDVPVNGYDVRHCYAVHKGDPVLLARLNEGLAILHRDGTFDAIYERWFGRYGSSTFTRQQAINAMAVILAFACAAAVWGLLRQRTLRHRLARQAAQLAESEAILAEAQQIAHVGHFHYDLVDRDLVFSAETLRILDRDTSHGPPTYSRLLAMVVPADRKRAHGTLIKARRSASSWDQILTIQTATGARKVVHAHARPVRGPEGVTTALFGTLQDITQQQAAEQGLRAREGLLRALYDNVPIAMGVVEPAGSTFRFVSANRGTAILLGIPGTDLADQVLNQLSLPPATEEFWAHWFRQGAMLGELLKTEQLFDASRRHYALTLVPLDTDTTGRTPVCFLVEDITERKQMDAEIAQGRKLRAVGELVGGIAHEFNNLLTPILLKTELMALEWSHDHRLLKEMEMVTRAAQRGADLTRRLLAFGRRSEAAHEEVRVHTLVTSNFGLLRPTVDRRIALEMDVPETLPALQLNPSDLHQIVLNLLLNARDTLVEKLDRRGLAPWVARLRVSAVAFGPEALATNAMPASRPVLGWVKLSFLDNGMGMAREVQERIFEPFYTTKEVGKGTGLGLATVWHLTTRLGGKVEVHSVVGEGTTFHIWLPVQAPAPRSAPTPAPALPGQVVRQGAKILLVEDDDLVAQTLIALLRRDRHTVTHFSHGEESWDHITTGATYDIIILDLDLPGLNGLEIARRIRAQGRPAKILISSGRLTEMESLALAELKVEGRLPKPFTPEGLRKAIAQCLGAPAP